MVHDASDPPWETLQVMMPLRPRSVNMPRLDVVFPSLDMEAVITVLEHSAKACIPLKPHQLIITPIIITIFSSMRCERYGTSKDPILEE